LAIYYTPLRNIGERCRDSAAVHAFYDGGNYIIKTRLVPFVYPVAKQELGKACARVQSDKSLCTVPLVTTPTLVDEIHELVPVASGTRTLGAPLAMDFSMADGPPAPHDITYVHSWLQDSVAAQPKYWTSNIVYLYLRLTLEARTWPFAS
jgi:hypothetical protein